ncbi:AMP-ligase [Stenotrophomonas pictorum JCM 9942]|uniref:AMP-ligase n=1 Tax=Stenotrophomonas pictorum JCM 9942 TaxID=1236960 RepID=A0A0R0AKZ1_9GAMM|nr:AMP-binding protein [Stenotrophomonas pictorum]KRG45225.1 AMP-ligase [Stenotrophomonas pictorum JCM 9942]
MPVAPEAASSRAVHPLATGPSDRPLAVLGSGPVTLATFLAQVRGVAAQLPAGRHAVNLCEDRYRFLVAFCAIALRGQVNLLPSSRAPAVVADVRQRYAQTYCVGDAAPERLPPDCHVLPAELPQLAGPVPQLAEQQLVAIGFTSGSTGVPGANPKTWGSFLTSTAQNLQALQDLWGPAQPSLVATVPPQHMYGMEMSVLLPLLAPATLQAGRPFFPQDVAQALATVPAPRLLVTTPVHLKALVESGVALPPLAGIVTATAPLPQELAAAAEQRFHTEVREVFGSTETCIFARRRTARETAWQLLPGVWLEPQPDGTRIHAPHLATPVLLADLVELLPGDRFVLRGRRADLLEIAGKRASLGDLTRKLQALEGVEDAVVLQLAPEPGHTVGRIAALVVAPQREVAELLQELRMLMDPVFLPRPLRKVEALPRNETGKLPRDALLALLGH